MRSRRKKWAWILVVVMVFSVLGTPVYAASANPKGSGYDTTAPLLNSVTLDRSSVIKPSVVRVTLDVTEDGTGIKNIGIYFCKSQGQGWEMTHYYQDDYAPVFTGKISFDIPVTTARLADEYYVACVTLIDKQGNYSSFSSNNHMEGWPLKLFNESNGNKESCLVNTTLQVKDEFDVAFQKYITNPNITKDLKNMQDEQTAMIDYDERNCTAKKEWFDAIKGTKKKIVFSNNSQQWIFDGKDIKDETKDINLLVKLNRIDGEDYGTTKDLLKLEFASNGALPGVATVKLKSDYIYTMYNLNNHLQLYFLNGEDLHLEDDQVTHILDGTDHWCKFNVAHNSTFLLSGAKLASKVQRNLVNASIAKISNKTYTGKAVKPKPTVSLNGHKLKQNTDYELQYGKNVNPGKAKITLTGKGLYKGKKTVYFYIAPQKTVFKKAVRSHKNMKLTWKRDKKATGYQITIATKKNFKKGKKTYLVTKNKVTTKTIKKLKPKRKYYIKIRSYKTVDKKKIYGPYSKIKTLKL
ncbi:hypothetical protein NE619_07700 [Anaerovorax odorimutans]|uniref:Fibronectin type-III domain-containing protein n=1 Tax=Anaerovorax odorimutans TaxID=109327 RepID=A0ABT1RN47_9FIRM|nr:fibronectin type III domain-containing protein [Anaerovorax odorimutans]MCQ4636610.1 hypothetical protein [Anaerovorax odorimutans]